MKQTLLLLLALASVSCTKNTEQPSRIPLSTKIATDTESVPRQAITPEQWTSALESTYEELHVEDKGDGITKFMAKFKLLKDRDEVSSLAFGQRDAFRKLHFYQMGRPMQIDTGVKVYISIKDYQRPVFFLQPYYWGGEWIFMQKIAVLVDGEMAIEHECPDTEREVSGNGVEEQCDLILSTSEIDALRRIKGSSTVSVRLTGQKGYVNVGRDGYNSLEDFSRDIQSAIAIYDVIEAAIKDKIPQPTG